MVGRRRKFIEAKWTFFGAYNERAEGGGGAGAGEEEIPKKVCL